MQLSRIVCSTLFFSAAVTAFAQTPAAVPQSAPAPGWRPVPQATAPAAPVVAPQPLPAASAAPAGSVAVPAAPTPEPSAVARTTTAVETQSISLQEAIDEALQHNFDVQISRFLPELARFNLGAAYGGYDPIISASGQHEYARSPGGLNPFTNTLYPGPETEADSFAAGLGGLLPWGLQYRLTGSARDSISETPPNAPVEVSTGNAAISELRQPLLRDFWIDATRATIQISRNRVKFSEQSLRLQMMNTVVAVEQAYYNLIFARENVKVQESALQLAERLLWENRKKVEVGQLAPLDEKQAESQVAASRADLLIGQRALDSQENVLKSLITDAYAKLHSIRLIPAENLVAIPPLLDLHSSWDRALRLRPDLIQARLDVQRSDINVRYDRNQLFPRLDLVGQYGYAGREVEYSGAFGQIKDRDNPYWYYGAALNYPIGNRAARNNYRASKAEREQADLIMKQREQGVLISVDDAVKRVQTDFARVEATREARLFAEAALDAEQKKLENGKSTSFFVLQFQRDLTAARFQEIQALTSYNNSLAQLAFQEGATFERHNLNVEIK
ncbi:MAG: TolC family protein [Verrucomicrobiia bacterium]